LILDEAIYANNALEMAINKDFWVLKNNDVATLYNVKPPLVIWLQCLCIWIFGANEFAIRLPSVLAAFFMCFRVFYFLNKHFNIRAAFLRLLVLVTSQGYVKVHVTRTGDLDSVLVFFITAYSLLIFDIILVLLC
jgi:4-amino-4-deoxy-L-arabinose transferase-like glycosyltransferase